MKQQLTKEEIQFIDTYLKKSGVEFIDVRIEMIDHVASEIENRLEENSTSSFYDEFKLYMIQHKKSLLKNINKYRFTLCSKILKQFIKNLFENTVLICFTLLIIKGLVLNSIIAISIEDLKLYFIFILGSSIFLSTLFPLIWFRNQQISVMKLAAVVCYFINYVLFRLIATLVDTNFIYYSIFILLISWVNISFVYTQVEYVKLYKNKFQLS
ncbi:hypothetical protein SAMN04488096_103234 [Mesonia phycicola]|uniref:Uncharacterized protein n=1 Tax=Mesonia phycicola TaxID=579105 RepID=A0A1M6CZI2_9FLAO|nr:hypothetical protein [Mesonia phycicola]SHI66432.1 hypothetical protein SAMN04488096_103234 [Mesonia phycicola]